MPLRVVVGGTNLRSRSIGGGETYAVGLANALARRGDVTTALVASEHAVARLSRVLDPSIEILLVAHADGVRRVLRDALQLATAIRSWGPSLLHYPHEWAPRSEVPTVLTLQNIAWLHPATRGDSGVRGRLLRTLARTTANAAADVIPVSSMAAELWERETGRPVTVPPIPEGFELWDGVHQDNIETDSDFILAISGRPRYKNLEMLLAAYSAVAKELALPILVAGVDGGPCHPGVRFLGRVDRTRLLELMRNAQLCIFPSIVESFGLPALESVAMGTPCVVLEGTPMSTWEAQGIISAPPSQEGIAAAMISGIGRPHLTAAEILQVRSTFSWDKVADQTVCVYRSVLH